MSREYIPAQLKKSVIERAHGCCEYCTSPSDYSPSPFAIEHIIPISKKGPTTADNLALACQGCNGLKYNKTTGIDPISNQIVPLFHPRDDTWHEHYAWNHDCTSLLGLTSSGRATIQTLKLNRIELLNLRPLLFMIGAHPPAIYRV